METEPGAGSRLGRFVLDTQIGRGGFGSVWVGHDDSGEQVAIKVLSGAGSGTEKSLIRAEVELLAGSASRQSMHVVKVLGSGIEPLPYIVMEYMAGGDLSQELAQLGRVSVDRTIEVGMAVFDALSALNEAGIIHRDVKPANVMLGGDGMIKLTDFGIAKIIGYETVTVAGEVALTMAYAAPEVWDNGEGVYGRPSHRSDLYAMGVLLFECLTGVPPFRGSYATLYREHHERRPDLSALPDETPASLRGVIRSCLEKYQDDRPLDATVCTAALRRAAVELAEVRRVAPSVEPVRFGPWRRGRPHPRLPWAWLCSHESTGEEATVEVRFAANVEAGGELRAAIAANPRLVELGAERLIETNRLLLRPGEDWIAPPAGSFQFWIARQEQEAPPPPPTVGAAELQRLAGKMVALIDAAKTQGITLSFRPDDVTILPGGDLRLGRPGIVQGAREPEMSALRQLQSLPLDAAARDLMQTVRDIRVLVPAQHDAERTMFMGATTMVDTNDRTIIAARSPSPTQPVAPMQQPAPPPAPARQLCSRCGLPLLPGDAFCGECGEPVAGRSETRCPRCREITYPTDSFCISCGQRLSR